MTQSTFTETDAVFLMNPFETCSTAELLAMGLIDEDIVNELLTYEQQEILEEAA